MGDYYRLMSFVIQTKEFEQALREYQAASKKDMADVLNRALRNVGFRAAEFTPKKDPATIDAELRKDKIGLKYITNKLTGKKGTTYTTAKGRTRTIRRVTRKQIALRTRQFFARRKKKVGFLRAGWVAALVSAGIPLGRGLGRNLTKGKSTIGSGRKATPEKLMAYLGNGVWGRLNGKAASKMRTVMQSALNRAMSFVANDMKTYAKERLSKSAKKHSATTPKSTASMTAQLAAMLRP